MRPKPILWITMIGASGIALMVWYFSHARQQNSELKVSTNSIDLGQAFLGETKKVSFQLENESNSRVWIREIRTSCSCILPKKPPASIASGESEQIDLDVQILKQGKSAETIQVFTTPETRFPLTVDIKYHARPAVSLSHRIVDLGILSSSELALGKQLTSHPVRVFNLVDAPLRKVDISAPEDFPGQVSAELSDL